MKLWNLAAFRTRIIYCISKNIDNAELEAGYLNKI